MTVSNQCRLVISGVGGQGVLFITGLLAQAAIQRGLRVMTSETHGMAQRGGTVISHLKIGDFRSPLIRPGNADALIALKAENLAQHGYFIKPGGLAVANAPDGAPQVSGFSVCSVNADAIANTSGDLRSVNLVVLGVAMAVLSAPEKANMEFFSPGEIRDILRIKMKRNSSRLEKALAALQAGYDAGTG